MAPPDQARALDELLATTRVRLAEFIAFLTPGAPPLATERIANPPSPLNVIKDAATLIKAHTTKIGLLAINKPFTPSAIAKVLRQLAGECLPALMSAVQICRQEESTWGSTMGAEARARVSRVFREMETLLEEVASIAQGTGGSTRRDSVRSTGVVWESCDALIDLEKLGIAGLAVQKAEQFRDTVKDAIDELKEWAHGEDPDTEGQDELLDDGDEGVDGDRESLEEIFHAANSMPKDRPELNRLVEEADGKLKKIVLLYTALMKRRLKTFKKDHGGDEAGVRRLDECVELLRVIPHQVDEMASCFYDLDDARATAVLSKCVDDAVAAVAVMRLGWNGQEDEFTAWSGKWKEAIS